MKMEIKKNLEELNVIKTAEEKKMVEKINMMCKEMKSNFSTEDGLTLVAYIGHLTFLKRAFNTIEECFNYVENAYNNTFSR